MPKKLTCKTGLKKNVISKTVFEREVLLCEELSKKGKKCGWGKCKGCGVLPLLYKLHKGILIEDSGELKKIKNTHLSK
jgi:hypothetical protein